jgi:hypothetical protein
MQQAVRSVHARPQASLHVSLAHLESVCAVAARVRVAVLVDAEQSHRQPAYGRRTPGHAAHGRRQETRACNA